MNADVLISLVALCFTSVSSNDDPFLEFPCLDLDTCGTHTLSAPLGSSVLLPCNFSTSSHNWVSWVHNAGEDLVQLTSKGRVRFVEPRHGRVKAFPNQGSEGNYSIRIDALKGSDMGCYRCEQGKGCLQVELVAEKGTASEEMVMLLCIFAAVAAFILLIVSGYGCMKCVLCYIKSTQEDANNPVVAGISVTPQESGSVPIQEQQRGADNLVYENDDQDPSSLRGGTSGNQSSLPGVQSTQGATGLYPNLDQLNFERVESHRRRLRFHTELLNRFRPASFSRHYYVNQGDISKQQAMSNQARNHRRVFRVAEGGAEKKKVKENLEYKNPIYNRSTEQLNRP